MVLSSTLRRMLPCFGSEPQVVANTKPSGSMAPQPALSAVSSSRRAGRTSIWRSPASVLDPRIVIRSSDRSTSRQRSVRERELRSPATKPCQRCPPVGPAAPVVVARRTYGAPVEVASRIQQRLYVLGTVQPHRGSLDCLEASSSAFGRIGLDQLVLNGDLENLSKPRDGLVDARGRKRASWAPMRAASLVHVFLDQRPASARLP